MGLRRWSRGRLLDAAAWSRAAFLHADGGRHRAAARAASFLCPFVCPEDFPHDAVRAGSRIGEDRVTAGLPGRGCAAQRRPSTRMSRIAGPWRSGYGNSRSTSSRSAPGSSSHRRRSGGFRLQASSCCCSRRGRVWWNSRRTALEVVKKPDRFQGITTRNGSRPICGNKSANRAAEEIAKLNSGPGLEKKSRRSKRAATQQLRDVDRLMEQIKHAFEKQRKTSNYVTAEWRRSWRRRAWPRHCEFLESKSGAREERNRGAQARTGRAAECNWQQSRRSCWRRRYWRRICSLTKAEAAYSHGDRRRWQLGRAAECPGLAAHPAGQSRLSRPRATNKLRQAVALCRETLLPQSQRATARRIGRARRTTLGKALHDQGTRAGWGGDAARLLAEAVECIARRTRGLYAGAVHRIGRARRTIWALRFGTKAGARAGRRGSGYWPRRWRRIARPWRSARGRSCRSSGRRRRTTWAPRFHDQGVRADGGRGSGCWRRRWWRIARPWKSKRGEQWPQQWAATQNNLGLALSDQGAARGWGGGATAVG